MEDLLMRAATVIAVALATLSSFPLTAQQDTPSQQQSAPSQQTSPAQEPSAPPSQQTTPSAVPDNQPAQNAPSAQGGPAASASAVQLQPVNGELVGKLDSKSAKTGDSVVVRTKENVKVDGTEIPKGSKLVGTVTGVQARGEGKENAQIAIKFDHAELKGGQNVAIESVIQSVSPAESYSSSNAGGSYGDSPAGAAPGGGSMPSGGAGASGGMNNEASSTSGSHTNAAPSNSAAAGSMASGTADANGAANGAPAPGSIVARNGNVAIRMTAIPGVLLANNVNGQPFTNASGLLLGARRDIHLDGGTQVVLAVATMPGAAGA